MTLHKYGAKKVEHHAGYSFGSKLEAAVYNILYLLQKAGEIKEIQVQDSVYLTDAEILYKPDFRVTCPDGFVYWVEAKGFETPEWRIKRRLWMKYGPGELQIWMGSASKPYLKEKIFSTATTESAHGEHDADPVLMKGRV